jgi:hypothetical protein
VKIEDLHRTAIEVEKLVSGMVEQLNNLEKSLDTQNGVHREAAQGMNDLRRDFDKEVVALKKDVEEFRRWAEKNATADLKAQLDVSKEKIAKLEAALERAGTRVWSVVPSIVGALVGAAAASIASRLTE